MKHCHLCGDEEHNESLHLPLYGFSICQACKSNLGLYQDKTILKHILSFEKAQELDPNRLSYEEEIDQHLDLVDKKHISTKIKLLHLQERIRLLK